MKRSELRRRPSRSNPFSSLSRGRGHDGIKKVSDKRALDQRVYSALRREWLADKACARCESARDLTVHHMAGRTGLLYLDVSKWLPLCLPCHQHVTDNPKEAIAAGYSLPRLSLEFT